MVLIEAISVVVRCVDVEYKYADGWAAFEKDVPSPTLCTDGEIACVGFMSPVDVEAYVRLLRHRGLRFQHEGKVQEISVVDQYRGPMVPCDWLEVRRVDIGPGVVVACALTGSRLTAVATPKGWRFDKSLSSSSGFVPAEHHDKALEYLRHENGVDVYRSRLTGEEVYVGRAGPAAQRRPDEESEEWREIKVVATRALELDAESVKARASRDRESAARIYGELMEKLLPQAERLADGAVRYGSFAHFAAGLVLRVLGLYEPAIVRFERSLAMQPGVTNSLLEITNCLGQLGKAEEAEKYARRAVAIEPDSAAAWGNLAMCLIKLGRKAQARQAIDRALSLDPADSKNNYIAANFERYFD